MQGELNPIIIWPHQENNQIQKHEQDTQGAFGRGLRILAEMFQIQILLRNVSDDESESL